MPPFWLLTDPVLQLTIQREIPEYAGGHLGGLGTKAACYFKHQPGEVLKETTDLGRVDVSDRELNILRQVAN